MAKQESEQYSLIYPAGWRVPTTSELKSTWRRANPKQFASVNGDFDGDGKLDEAKLLVSVKEKKFGIFIWLIDEASKNPIQVLTEPNISALQYMGIDLYKAGNYKTACGKGYFECKKDELSEIKLRNDAINYFKDESVNSIFYWVPEKKVFVRTWMSD